jgi:peptidyl-prolyl cis-trans isomerase SurA
MRTICRTLAAVALGLSVAAVRADLADGIKAVVHDSVITIADVELLTAQTGDVLLRQFRADPVALEKKTEAMRTENLEKLLGQQLILRDFKTAGYNLPESVIDEEVADRIRSKYGDRVHLTKSLQAEGITFERFRQRIREQFIVQALRQKNISSEIIVSPHKMEAYYLAHRDDFKMEDEVKIQMIVLKQPAAAEPALPEPPSAEKRAEEILSKLKEGAKFTEMAAVYSEGSQRKSDWGWWELSRLSKGLADVAATLSPGQYSKVMSRTSGEDYWMYQYENGQPALGRHYVVDPATKKEKLAEERKLDGASALAGLPPPAEFYVMLVEDKRPTHFKSLGEVRAQIEKDLVLEERSRLEKQWIEKLKKKTFVRYF